jgi:HEAT repeat protein
LAIRAIGTNALPTLLRWVEHEPSSWGERLRSFAASLPSPLADLGFVQKLAQWGHRPSNWPQAFQVLGADANSAVPELTRLLRREPAVEDLGAVPALALAYIGPAGLPPLLAAAADPNASCQVNAIFSFSDMGTNALPAIPQLIRCLVNTNLEVAQAATGVLCELRLRPDIVLPALAKCLQSPDPETRILAAAWLAEVEAYSPAACQVLFAACNDPSEEVRSLAQSAIDAIPEEIEATPSPTGEKNLQ